MKHLVRLVAALVVGGIAYLWLNTEVPGGEKRYEQYIRLALDRHSIPGM